jgi:hypothetical protein
MRKKIALAVISALALLGLAAPAGASQRSVSHNVKVTVYFASGDKMTADCNRVTFGTNIVDFFRCIHISTVSGMALGSTSRPHQYVVNRDPSGVAAEGCYHNLTHTGQPGHMHYFVHNATRGANQVCS